MTVNQYQKERVYQVVAQVLGVPPAEIDENASPDTVAAWDSMSHLRLVVALEEAFGVSLSDEDVTDMLSVGLMVRILRDQGVPGL